MYSRFIQFSRIAGFVYLIYNRRS